MTWVITGDSITHGAAHTHGSRSYAEHFAERVRWEMRRTRDVVVNTGISGNRTEDLLDDYDWRVAKLAPNVVSLMIGTNDAVAGEKGLATYRANLLTLIERIRQDRAIPILQTPNPVDPEQLSRRAALPEYVEVMREVAKEASVLLVDQYAYWEEQCPTRESMLLWLADPIHPNAKGHLMFAQEMFRVLEVFDETAATCQPLPAEAEILKVQEVEATEAKEVNAALLLPPSEGNPRNSEGDFIKLRDGRLLFVYTHFYGGGDDHSAARLAARYSEDGGQTWSDEDETIVDNEGGMNIMSVSLLRLADGKVALFYLRKDSTTNNRPVVRISSDEARTWSEPIPIIPDEQNGYYVLNNDRVIQIKSGRLIAPVAQHNGFQMEEHGEWTSNGLTSCYLSDDGGKSWRRSEDSFYVANPESQRIASQEPGVVELTDGRILMFIRTSGGVQYISYSNDGGETWSKAVPSSLRSPVSPASIERIPKTGHLVAVWNNSYDSSHRGGGKRTPLNAAISRDEGKTWSEPRVLFDDPDGWYCYTAIHFEGDFVLLGHCAGGQGQGGAGLSVTQITRFPISLLYD
jgi:sialidase-1